MDIPPSVSMSTYQADSLRDKAVLQAEDSMKRAWDIMTMTSSPEPTSTFLSVAIGRRGALPLCMVPSS